MRLYTALGKLCPQGKELVVRMNGREYGLTGLEPALLIPLGRHILTPEELNGHFSEKWGEGLEAEVEGCLDRLVRRGLAARGEGDTVLQAVENLLSGLRIVPMPAGLPLRFLTFLGMFFRYGPHAAVEALRSLRPQNGNEEAVMSLLRRRKMTLDTLITCFQEQGDRVILILAALGGLYRRRLIHFEAAEVRPV